MNKNSENNNLFKQNRFNMGRCCLMREGLNYISFQKLDNYINESKY